MNKEEAKKIKRQKTALLQVQEWLHLLPDGTKVSCSWSEKVFVIELKKLPKEANK